MTSVPADNTGLFVTALLVPSPGPRARALEYLNLSITSTSSCLGDSVSQPPYFSSVQRDTNTFSLKLLRRFKEKNMCDKIKM